MERKDNELPECIIKWNWKYHHLGIPTKEKKPNEKYLPQFKFYVSGFNKSPFGHVAFGVDNLDDELSKNKFKILTEPNPPSDGLRVAMIEHNGVRRYGI